MHPVAVTHLVHANGHVALVTRAATLLRADVTAGQARRFVAVAAVAVVILGIRLAARGVVLPACIHPSTKPSRAAALVDSRDRFLSQLMS
jgi:hypothetical protein